MAHAILGAATSYATGQDIGIGALSAVSSEATAPVLSKFLFGKDSKELTQDEKDTITSIITLATASTAYAITDGDVANSVSATEVGRVGVGNNYVTPVQTMDFHKALLECYDDIKCQQEVNEYYRNLSYKQDDEKRLAAKRKGIKKYTPNFILNLLDVPDGEKQLQEINQDFLDESDREWLEGIAKDTFEFKSEEEKTNYINNVISVSNFDYQEAINNSYDREKFGMVNTATDIATSITMPFALKKQTPCTPDTVCFNLGRETVVINKSGGKNKEISNPKNLANSENVRKTEHNAKLTTTRDGNLSVTHGLSYDAKKELDGIRAALIKDQEDVKAFNKTTKRGERKQESLIKGKVDINADISVATATVTTKDGKTINYLAVSGKSWNPNAPDKVTINGKEYQVLRDEAYTGRILSDGKPEKVLSDKDNLFIRGKPQKNGNHAEKKIMSHITQQNQNGANIDSIQLNIQNTSDEFKGTCYGCGGQDGMGGTIQDFKNLNPDITIRIEHGSTNTSP